MLEAIFTSGVDEIEVSGLTQWDRGQQLQITCPDLPTLHQVHFAFKGGKVALNVTVLDSNIVDIPDEILQQPRDIIAYVYLIGSDGSGETVKTINLPLVRRAKPEDYTSDLTPTQMERIEAMLQSINEKAEAAVDTSNSANTTANNANTQSAAAQQAASNAAASAAAAEKSAEDSAESSEAAISAANKSLLKSEEVLAATIELEKHINGEKYFWDVSGDVPASFAVSTTTNAAKDYVVHDGQNNDDDEFTLNFYSEIVAGDTDIEGAGTLTTITLNRIDDFYDCYGGMDSDKLNALIGQFFSYQQYSSSAGGNVTYWMQLTSYEGTTEEYSNMSGDTWDDYIITLSGKQVYYSAPATVTDGYVFAYDENAYSGDAYTYTGPAGCPARLETGLYAGTGAYGSSNKTSLTFSYKPKMVILQGADLIGVIILNGTTYIGCSVGDGYAGATFTVSYDDATNTLSWYASNAENQMCDSGYTFGYVAIR